MHYSDKVCKHMFSNLFCDVWFVTLSIIQCTYTSLTILTNYETRLLVESGFCHSIELTPWHSWYVLVMIKHFSKWLELVPLPNCRSEGVTYAFLDRVLSRLGVPSKVLIDQSTKFHGEFQELCAQRHWLIIALFHKTILKHIC
jgi:hypothetical protein